MEVGLIEDFPFYDPWIGAEYADRRRRIQNDDHFSGSNWFVHVLGESHYVDDAAENSRDLTKRVVCRYSDPAGSSAVFFNRVLQAVQGCDYYAVNRDGWSDIAFSNYVQTPMSASRVPPNDEQWAQAAKSLVGQLSITQPRVLLVLGKRNWDWFTYNHSDIMDSAPPLDVFRNGSKIEDAKILAYQLGAQTLFTIAVWTYHPSSSRFNGQAANDRVIAADMFHDNLIIEKQKALLS